MREYEAARRDELAGYGDDDLPGFKVTYRDKRPSDPDDPTSTPVEVKVTETFVCHGHLSGLMISDLAWYVTRGVVTAAARAAQADAFRDAFGPDHEADFYRFRNLARRHLDDETVGHILGGLIADFTGRPTMRQSSLQPGLSPTGDTSKVVEPSPPEDETPAETPEAQDDLMLRRMQRQPIRSRPATPEDRLYAGRPLDGDEKAAAASSG